MIPIRFNESSQSKRAKDATHYILGDDHVGIAIAEQLPTNGQRVATVNESHKSDDVPGFVGDPSAIDVLSEAGVGTASTVLVATRSDRRNLLIAQLIRTRFDVSRIITFVNEPDRIPLFAEAGHEPFCVTSALSQAVGEAV